MLLLTVDLRTVEASAPDNLSDAVGVRLPDGHDSEKKSILVFDGMLSAELTRGKRKKLEANSKAGRRNLQRFDLSGNVSSLSCSLCRLLHFVWAVGQLSAFWMGERKSRQKTKDKETEIQQMTKQLERRISVLINFLNEFAMRRHFCSDF